MREPIDIDLVVWPDGTWCFFEEIKEMNHKSDDYRIVTYDSAEAEEITVSA